MASKQGHANVISLRSLFPSFLLFESPSWICAEDLSTRRHANCSNAMRSASSSIDDLLQSLSGGATFDKANTENTNPVEIPKIIENSFSEKKFIDIPETKEFVFEKVDASNLNDKLKKTINIGLNDKIAFEQNLFGGSSEDFNRVVLQISTFDSLSEAKVFINEMVKPDYNNWKDKDEFADRFMEIVESKFS